MFLSIVFLPYPHIILWAALSIPCYCLETLRRVQLQGLCRALDSEAKNAIKLCKMMARVEEEDLVIKMGSWRKLRHASILTIRPGSLLYSPCKALRSCAREGVCRGGNTAGMASELWAEAIATLIISRGDTCYPTPSTTPSCLCASAC